MCHTYIFFRKSTLIFAQFLLLFFLVAVHQKACLANEKAFLKVIRLSGYTNLGMDAYIYLDGHKIGSIGDNETSEFSIPSKKDKQSLVIKDFSGVAKSDERLIKVSPGDIVLLEFKLDFFSAPITKLEVESSSVSNQGSTNNLDKTLETQTKALGIIATFASELCGAIPLNGKYDNLELSGNAKADLSNVVKKVVDLGIEGAAKYQTGEYNGLLQADLIKSLKDSKDCKLQVWSDLKEKLLF